MVKIQYIKLLALRGVTELKKGETMGMAYERTGGAGSLEEMVQVNEQAMFHYIDKYKEQEEINKGLLAEIEKLKAKVDKLSDDSLMLSCYRRAGVDNWDGAGYAEEIYDELKAEQL